MIPSAPVEQPISPPAFSNRTHGKAFTGVEMRDKTADWTSAADANVAKNATSATSARAILRCFSLVVAERGAQACTVKPRRKNLALPSASAR